MTVLCHLCRRELRDDQAVSAGGVMWCPDQYKPDCYDTARERIGIPSHIRFELRAKERVELAQELSDRDIGISKFLKDAPRRPRDPEFLARFSRPDWAPLRERVLKRDGYRCRNCHQAKRDLDVHHLTYRRFGRELLSDLITWCGDCHALSHLTGAA